jgi:8-oxo-dGTP pyrophosphatase MutT (NUDIX family)
VFNAKNELLLLHRVKTSSAFPSAHVFPGGTLSEYHETVPPLGSRERHFDGPAYRLAAVRETFEESGILLARNKQGQPIHLPPKQIESGRKAIHGDKMRFSDWLEKIGGEPDVGAY